MADSNSDSDPLEEEEEEFRVPLALTTPIVCDLWERWGEGCPMALRTTGGAKTILDQFLRTSRMKVSGLDNAERWRRVVRHAVPAERHLADPQHYHRFPYGVFWRDLRFWRHFFATLFAFFHNDKVLFALSVVLLYHLHLWSFVLYTQPLPWLGAPISCARLPVQFPCATLKLVQDNTFSGFNDILKLGLGFLTQQVLAWVAWAVVPRVK